MRPLLPAAALLSSCWARPGGPPPGDDTAAPDDTGAEAPQICPEGLEIAAEVRQGCMRGLPTARGEAFLGVPYAEPPIGERRWRRPAPAEPWAGVLDAVEAGPACAQGPDLVDGDPADETGEEDCLTLNIWRRAGLVPGVSREPVLFYVHGGGFLNGSGLDRVLSDDPSLAQQGIVVTHNARLGPLGFLAHPELSVEEGDGASGNQGLFDTLEALRWVHENAAALGGDPDRVLLFGSQSGGLAVCALAASPLAEGLFSAAIVQSAPCGTLTTPLRGDDGEAPSDATGEGRGALLAEALGCVGEGSELGCMRQADVSAVLSALPPSPAPLAYGTPWGPVLDGVLVPEDLAERYASGEAPGVPLVIGANANDGAQLYPLVTISFDRDYLFDLRFEALLTGYGVEEPDALLDHYSADVYGSNEAAFAAFYTDALFVCPTERFLAGLPPDTESFAYSFSHVLSFASEAGAFTGAELPLLFGTSLDLYSTEEVALSEALQAAWVWSASGWPALLDLGDWPYARTGDWVSFGDDVTLTAAPRAAQCALLADSGWRYGG